MMEHARVDGAAVAKPRPHWVGHGHDDPIAEEALYFFFEAFFLGAAFLAAFLG